MTTRMRHGEVHSKEVDMELCEMCQAVGFESAGVGHTNNPDWCGYLMCEECLEEYEARLPIEFRPEC